MSRIITIGEPLGEFIADEKGPLRDVQHYTRNAVGTELCYAIGMARLGYDVTYVTKVGSDSMGQYLIDFMKQQGLSIDHVKIVDEAPTGIIIKDRSNDGWPTWEYYRHGSAATYLTKYDVREIDYSNIDHMHVTGIALSISDSACKAVMEMIHLARENGITVSFDPNIRGQMWKNKEEICKVINGISLLCDIIFPEYEEAVQLLGIEDPEKIADFYLDAGVKTVVIKSLTKGIFVKNKKVCFWANSYDLPEHPVDLMGLGEGFVCGVTSAILEGRNLEQAVERGRVIASNIANYYTAHEGLPNRELLHTLVDKFYAKDLKCFEDKKLILPPTELDDCHAGNMKENARKQLDPGNKKKKICKE